MAINVKIDDVVHPQRLAMVGTREGGNPEADADTRLMIVYTGWIAPSYGVGSDQEHETAVSFVPNELGQIQSFKPDNEGDLGVVQAVVTSSLSSFGSGPEVAAVDQASVSLEPFGEAIDTPRVLILRAQLSASDGAIHGFSYQVTVLANPLLLDKLITLNPGATPP